jgi:uncharacterized membrane protein
VAALVLTAAAALLDRFGGRTVMVWVLTALVLYTIGVGITVGFNIPLNDELEQAGNPDGIADLAAVRERFEDPWVAWHIVRTLLSIAAFGALIRALVLYGRAETRRRTQGAPRSR